MMTLPFLKNFWIAGSCFLIDKLRAQKALRYESFLEKMGVIWTVTRLARYIELVAIDFFLLFG